MSGEILAILAVGVALAGVILTSIRGLRQDIRQDMARKKSRMGPLVKAECADVAGAMTATGSLSAADSP